MNLPAVLNRSDVVGVEGLTNHVEDVTKDGVTDRHGNTATGLAHHGATNETVGRLHADATDAAFTDLLGHFGRDVNRHTVDNDFHLDGVVDLRQRVRREFNVHHRTGNRDNATRLQRGLFRSHSHSFLTFPSEALRRRPRFP